MMKHIVKLLAAILIGNLISSCATAETDNNHSSHSHTESTDHDKHHDKHTNKSSTVGQPVEGITPNKHISVTTLDSMRFTFEPTPSLQDEDIVKFTIKNTGKIPHEFTIGSASEQQQHREMMLSSPHGEHGDSGNAVTVKPGETKTLLWQFSGHEPVLFACNIPGHFEAGMKHEAKIN